MDYSVLQKHIFFIFTSYELREDYDELETNRLKREWHTKERQNGTPYTKWLRYLKNKRLYGEYVKDIKVLMYAEFKLGKISQFISDVVFTPCTMNQVKEVIMYIDSHVPFKHYNGGYWRSIFDDFEAEGSLAARKKLLASKLYHMNVPTVTHHKYLGSTKPTSHFFDDLIDKIFFIKKK